MHGPAARFHRREFLFAAGALMAAPFGAHAQKLDKPYRIGLLGSSPNQGFQQSLRELGYVEGRDFVLETRDIDGRLERLDKFAADLVSLKVDVIVAPNPAAVFSAKRMTAAIPIVMMNTPDPVELGIVASLARPGGNITGVSTLSVELSVKQLELLRESVPRATHIALVWNPDNPWHAGAVKRLQARRESLGLQLRLLEVRGPDAFATAFKAMSDERVQALLVLTDPMTFAHRRRLAELAIHHRLPMMGGVREYAEAGSLISYWADRTDLYRRVASYVDRIVKGAKPADLPIEQPTKFEFLINLKTAATLGIAIPQSALIRADRLIE